VKDKSCIFCHLESNEIVIEENGYYGKKCPNCNLIYTTPRPKLDEIIDFYGHDHSNISAQEHIEDKFVKQLYAKHNLNHMRHYVKGGTMLEIGAGAGYFLKIAKEYGYEVYGIELNEKQAIFIQNGLNVQCESTPLSDKSFGNKKFDIIYHCDVISHFYDPIAEFVKTKSKLNNNGYIIFETGNLSDVEKKYYKYLKHFQYPDHLFFFGDKNIKILLEQTGFELIKIYRYSILPQLYLLKLIRRFATFFNTNRTDVSPNLQSVNSQKGRFDKFIKNLYSYFFYLIRYKLGRIVPKHGRPQTIIVIARSK